MPLAYIQFLDDRDRPVDPGFGRPGYGGGRPDHELPDPGRPTKPVDPDRPPDVDELPGQPLPPGQLPSLPAPPGDLSGKIVVLVWKPGEGWSGKVLDKPTKPERPPGRPDIGLPGEGRPPHVGGGPAPQPPRPDQGLPPEAQPKPGYPEEQARWNR